MPKHPAMELRPIPVSAPLIPVVTHIHVPIGASERSRLVKIGERRLRNEPALSNSYAFGENVRSGMLVGPMPLIGDHREIPLISGESGALYQHRMSLLARAGDMVVFTTKRHTAFENYLETTLKLGAFEGLEIETNEDRFRRPLADLCMRDHRTLTGIVSATKQHGCLTIMPHIGTGSARVLAGAIAEAAGRPVSVAAPPPRLTQRANDKLWFSELVAEVLGLQAQPKAFHAYGPAALAGQVQAIARQYERVVIKVPDSAGSAGNNSIWSHDIRQKLLSKLHRRGWRDRYPLLTQVWDCDVASTPSVQLWIPHPHEAGPIIEGIFEQTVEGLGGEFVGSCPAELSTELRALLAEQACQLATVLQFCGYYGRCSFDAVIIDARRHSGRIHWIECNGRWGGVSVPMTLVNRLTGDWVKRPFVVVQKQVAPGKKPVPFCDALERIEEQLFIPGRKDEGIVILTPQGTETGSGLHFAALGKTVAGAKARARKVGACLQSEPGIRSNN